VRFANVDGRGAVVVGDGYIDVGDASDAALPYAPMALLDRWPEVVAWSETLPARDVRPLDPSRLAAPVPRPGSIFGLVANYPPATRPEPAVPMVFGKFPNSICGPFDDIVLPAAAALPMNSEWTVLEAELAVVIGTGGRRIEASDALHRVAGFTVAQDITERVHEFGPRGTTVGTMEYASLKSMGKSLDTFCPLGPVLVTLDELSSPNALDLECRLNGEIVQRASTAELLFNVAELVAFLSSFATLRPGDVVLTGTPTPTGGQLPRLSVGDVIETTISGIGTLRNTCAADSPL
jgi:2-keto-4-pentenoate hydratase/2-oxohepta-3-ene-1,7-dioic acid hydratase in catechol pathway